MESVKERIRRITREDIAIAAYDPAWPHMFQEEKKHLLSCLPNELLGRIEHFGSTAIPGLSAKPIVDLLVEVTSLEKARSVIVPILEAQGYDYFWRPTSGNDRCPFYAWFIKRDSEGKRTHHIHMVEKQFEHWDRLLFRDYLVEHPSVAKEYEELKCHIAAMHPTDRIAYTNSKDDFVARITETAKRHYNYV